MRRLHPSFPTILFDDKDQSCRLGSSMIRWGIRDLDYFLTCCKAGSFTAATRDAHIAQSAHVKRHRPARAGSRGATVRPERHAGTLTEHGRRCRRAHSGYLTLSRQPTTTLRPSMARSGGTVTLGTTLHTRSLDLARVLANVHKRHPDVSLNCTSPRTVQWAPAIGRRRVNALSPAPSNMSLINRRMESLPHHLLNVKQVGLVVPWAGGSDAGRALSHDGSMRYAQRGGHTSAEQERWEWLRQQ